MNNEQILAQMLTEALKERDIIKKRGDHWLNEYMTLSKEFDELKKVYEELIEKLDKYETPTLLGEEI